MHYTTPSTGGSPTPGFCLGRTVPATQCCLLHYADASVVARTVDGRICTLGQQHLFCAWILQIISDLRPWHKHTLRYNIEALFPDEQNPHTVTHNLKAPLGGVRTLVQARRERIGAPDGDVGAPHWAGTVVFGPEQELSRLPTHPRV